MLQDLRAGKKTEIDGLCGAVLELAEKHSVNAPYNRIMYKLIKSME
jgi:ketopantoate reductase